MSNNPQTPDRLDDLRAEYANTGMVTSDGAVWLFSQVVVLREQVQRLSAQQPAVPAAPATHATDRAERRTRYAAAMAVRDGDTWPTEYESDEGDYLRRADAVIAVADAEQVELRAEVEQLNEVSRRLLEQRQEMAEERYAWQERGDRAEAELRRMADEAQQQPDTETPYTPPAHYVRDDGVQCCVHAIPVGPDSCRECRDLDQPAVPAKTAASDVLAKAVAALQAKAAELSTEAEEEMRRDLEEQAQVWHEAADMVRRVGRKAARRG